MISIVTSLYKSEQHLPVFLESARTVHKDLKKEDIAFQHLIIANDISETEKSLLENSKLTFTVITVERESLYASWNRGVHEGVYPNATFWAVDDTRFAKAIIKGLKTLENGYDATYFPYIYKRYMYIFGIKILALIKIVNPLDYNKELFMVGMYAGPHFIFKKESFQKIGPFDDSYKIAGDFDWWARAAKSDLKLKKTSTLSGVFTNNGKTLSGSKSDLQNEENARVVTENNS